MTNSFNYYKSYPAMRRGSYPYTGVRGTCRYSNGVLRTTGYVNVAKNDPTAHMNALQGQPITAAIAASSSIYRYYKSGIISSTSCGTSLNHAVNIIGYGIDAAGTKYWLLRNSWGTNWGEAGYFRVLRSDSVGTAICNILGMSSYPTI